MSEQDAIAELQKLAKRWPASLMLYVANGTINVVHTLDYRSGLDREDVLARIDGIFATGFPWGRREHSGGRR